jgi:hypothetical protein
MLFGQTWARNSNAEGVDVRNVTPTGLLNVVEFCVILSPSVELFVSYRATVKRQAMIDSSFDPSVRMMTQVVDSLNAKLERAIRTKYVGSSMKL